MTRTLLIGLVLGAATTIATAQTINDSKTSAKQDCSKDDKLTVNGSNVTVELTGTCAQVTLNGNQITLNGSAQKVSVNGNNNTLAIGTVDALALQGNNNTVTWKSGVHGAPKVSNLGSGNTITQSK
jgi:hypothetical protein